MTTLYPNLVLEALEHVVHPAKNQNIVELGMVEDDIRINGMRLSFSLLFDRAGDPMVNTIKRKCVEAIHEHIDPAVEVEGNIFVKIRQRKQAEPQEVLPEVKHVIAVASGKGGVGKSTITVNLAIALAQAGFKVGLLDADIFGPSIPIMLDTEAAKPVLSENSQPGKDLIAPVENYGVKMLSIGYFVDQREALIWRGAMATNALRQLITEGDWGALDFLLIDMPPGTSDIHLSLVGSVKLTGAVIVSTPQKVALADAIKGISMFQNEKINVPILGIVENMAWFTPAELPENRYYIFGQGGAQKLSDELGIPLLAQIPLVQSIREQGDAGRPAALSPDSATGMAFADLARRVTEEVKKL